MKHVAPPIALVVPVVLAACSSAPAGYPSTTQLQADALTMSDLPFGWAQSPPSTANSVTASCSAINSNAGMQLPAHAEADFQQSEDGPFLQEILASGTAQQVHAAWTSVQTAASRCSIHLSALPFPSYGDETYALELTADMPGVTFGGDVIVIRSGQVLVEVVVFGIGGVPPSLVQQLVAKSLAKLPSQSVTIRDRAGIAPMNPQPAPFRLVRTSSGHPPPTLRATAGTPACPGGLSHRGQPLTKIS